MLKNIDQLWEIKIQTTMQTNICVHHDLTEIPSPFCSAQQTCLEEKRQQFLIYIVDS